MSSHINDEESRKIFTFALIAVSVKFELNTKVFVKRPKPEMQIKLDSIFLENQTCCRVSFCLELSWSKRQNFS